MGNRNDEHVAVHPLRGQLFENLVIADTIKREWLRAGGRSFHFSRDNHGVEVDLVVSDNPSLDLIEIKSGMSVHPDNWKYIPTLPSRWNQASS